MTPQQPNQTVTLVISGLVILVLLGLRVMRTRQARPLRINMLWIGPLFVLVMAIFVGWFVGPLAAPFDAPSIAALAAALVGGALLGWFRSKTVHIRVDAESGSVTSQGTNLSLVFLLVFLASRFALRFVLRDQNPLSSLMMKVNLGYVLFAVGAICAAAFELRTRALALIARGDTAA